MAKKEKALGSKTVNKRSIAQLKAMGDKGQLIAMVQRSFGLAGSPKEGYKGILGEYKPKAVNGVSYQIVKKDGKLLRLDEGSETYRNILSLAKSAKSSVVKNEYNGDVEAFINAVVNLGGAGGGGGKRSGAVLEDFTWE